MNGISQQETNKFYYNHRNMASTDQIKNWIFFNIVITLLSCVKYKKIKQDTDIS